ncbi:uncharacterized protein TNCV_4407671 [Trichonephila clavipes]|nr:uncharacterized protein TNCV_4407671 [Trichonephila clavipes]
MSQSDSDLPDFPRLTWTELQYLTLGIYQLKQSRSYTLEHLNQSGLYSLYGNREDSSVVQLQLRSRYKTSKVYNIWRRTGIIQTLNGIDIARLVLELLVAVHMLHLYFDTWDYWCDNHTQTTTSSLGNADTFQDAATGRTSDDSASESQKEI